MITHRKSSHDKVVVHTQQAGQQVASFPAKYGTAPPLTSQEQEEFESLQKELENHKVRYEKRRDKILRILNLVREYPTEARQALDMHYLFNRMDSKIPELDSFFDKLLKVYPSKSRIKQLEKSLTWYSTSRDGEGVLQITLDDLETRFSITPSIERNDLALITRLDEEIFENYLKKPKPPVTVFRGDGRDVKENFFDSYIPKNIIAGGERDISLFGVVQHTHSNTYKNGMVSTTEDPKQALDWATDKHKYGVVYEFELVDYIHVEDLLMLRNFKNRFAAQKEILVPGNIEVDAIRSVTLYRKFPKTDEIKIVEKRNYY